MVQKPKHRGTQASEETRNETAQQLRYLLAMIDAGELDCTSTMRVYLVGVVEGLQAD